MVQILLMQWEILVVLCLVLEKHSWKLSSVFSVTFWVEYVVGKVHPICREFCNADIAGDLDTHFFTAIDGLSSGAPALLMLDLFQLM